MGGPRAAHPDFLSICNTYIIYRHCYFYPKMVDFYHERVEMGLNIKSPTAEKAIRDLAAATGEGLTEAVKKAALERLERISKAEKPAQTAEELLEMLRPLQEAIAAERLANGDTRTSQELMDELYDEYGLPV
jgi:antitoxin VapB